MPAIDKRRIREIVLDLAGACQPHDPTPTELLAAFSTAVGMMIASMVPKSEEAKTGYDYSHKEIILEFNKTVKAIHDLIADDYGNLEKALLVWDYVE